MNSEKLSETPSHRPLPKWLILAFAITAFIGFLDATYLTVEHYTGGNINCYISTGCDTVANSKYAVVLGIPMALLGAIFYFGMLILSILYLDIKKKPLIYLLVLGGITGFLFSIFLVYLQLFVLHSVCEYCMLSATTSTLLFIWGIVSLAKIADER